MRKNFNIRAFVAIALFFLIIVLFITAVAIQILDEIIEPQTLISLYLDPDQQSPYSVKLIHGIKAIHVAAGFIFAAFSVFHIIINWNSLKAHFKKKKA